MASIITLWLPILLSAVAVFIVSSIIHMFLGYHNTDFKKIPTEEGIIGDLQKHNIPPGDYVMPYASSNKERQTEEFKAKMDKGPVAFMTVYPNGQISMGSSLILWFLYCVVIGMFSAYISWCALGSGAGYVQVLRFAGITAFAGYGLALLQNSIWYKRNWAATIKSVFDALIYAFVTGSLFSWMWPAAQ